jgi:GDPmannose 4,6-dehydratase
VKVIAYLNQEKLDHGNLDLCRDWGWAPEYLDAMHRMLKVDKPNVYVIASGNTHSLRELVDLAFQSVGLDPNEWIDVSESLLCPSVLHYSAMDPIRIEKDLGWKTSMGLNDIVDAMHQPL